MLANFSVSRGSTQRWILVVALIGTGMIGGVLLARLPLTYGFAAVAGLCYAAGLLYDPIAGLAGALFLGPLWAWLMIQPSVIPAHVGQYALLVFLILSFINLILQRKKQTVLKPQSVSPPLMIPLCIFLGAALLSLWNPVDTWQGFTEFAKWAQLTLIFIILYDRLTARNSPAAAGLMLVMLAGSGLLQACIGIWQFAFRADGPETFAISSRFYRAYGTFMQPNPYAGFVAMMASIMVGLTLSLVFQRINKRPLEGNTAQDIKPFWMVILVISAGLLTVGLVASWSRGGWVGFAAAFIVMILLIPKKWQWGLVLIPGLLIIGWVFFSMGILPEDITSRLAGLVAYTQYSDIRSVGITDANFSTLERMAHWQAAVNMWRSRFWLGIGLGGYESAYPAFRLPNWTLPLGHAHNIYLNMLAETGFSWLACSTN